MLSMDDFESLSLDAKDRFKRHYARYPPEHSEDMFSTMIAWMHYVEYYYAFVDDNLIILGKDGEKCGIRPPSGPRNDELLRGVVEMARGFDSPRPIVAVKEHQKEWINSLYPLIKFTHNRDYFDYVYRAGDLAELAGKNYAGQRKAVNKFARTHRYEIEPICEQNIDDINEFLGRWCLWRDCDSDDMLSSEREAILYTMGHCMELDLCGIVLKIGSNIEAISVFEEMRPDTAIVHFEKAMPDYPGIYQTINMEAAKLLVERGYEFVNRESDLGIAGLREAKERLHPVRMEKVSYVKREDL